MSRKILINGKQVKAKRVAAGKAPIGTGGFECPKKGH